MRAKLIQTFRQLRDTSICILDNLADKVIIRPTNSDRLSKM